MMEFVSADILTSLDLERPIEGDMCVDAHDFAPLYQAAAKAAEEVGDQSQALVYRLLAAICSFHFRPADKTEPFSNMVGFADGSRSLVGSDFGEDQISALYAAIGRVRNIALRTRLADLIWTRDKARPDCARAAIDGYVELVRSLIAGTGTERFHDPDPTGVAAEEFLE